MARFVIFSVVVVAAAFFAAVEARLIPIVAPTNLTNLVNALADNARKMSGVDECAWTCEHVRNKKMCDALRKLPGVSSPRELLSAAVKMSMGKAKAAKAKFEAAARASKQGNPMASILDDCIHGYDSVVSSLEEVQQCIDTNDSKANLVSKMSAASTFAGDCATGFEEREMDPLFGAVQHNVARVVSSTLAIAANLKQ